MRCIGLDIGSSSIKGGVLDPATGRVAHIERAPFPDPVPGLAPGMHEVPLDAILQGARRVVEALLRAAPDARRLRVSSQMGGVVLVGADGRPLTRYLSWRDQRALRPAGDGAPPPLERLRAAWTDATFEELGKELKPGSTTALLRCLADAGALPPGATPATIGDWVVAALCAAPARMHRTHAIGLIDLRSGDWHHDAFAAAGIGGLRWPALAGESEPVGLARFTGGRTLDCFAAIGDQQAALFGIDLAADELSINCSTGSQVSRITPQFQPGDCQSRCWFGGRFLNTVTHIPAGRSLAVLEALLTELPRAAGLELTQSWRLIAEATERATGGGLACDLGFFASAMGDQGRIERITTENLTVGNLFCAAFDFMADSYLACSRRLAATPEWSRVAVSGGLVQAFPALRRRLAARFPLPMREVPEQEETLIGLLKLDRATPP